MELLYEKNINFTKKKYYLCALKTVTKQLEIQLSSGCFTKKMSNEIEQNEY